MADNPTEFLLYVAEDGQTRIDVRVQDENVWLNQLQLAELFQTTKQNISLHIKNVLRDGELDASSTVKDYLTVQTEGRRAVTRGVAHYNLDMIIAVGFRVRSTRGTQFRQWASARLGEYIIKGFTLDDERLSQSRHDYFDELVRRVRRIRVSERRYYQKITDIFATSMDYDPKSELTNKDGSSYVNPDGVRAANIIRSMAEEIAMLREAAKGQLVVVNYAKEAIAERDRLREALKPFSVPIADFVPDDATAALQWNEQGKVSVLGGLFWRASDFRRARAALEGSGG